MAKLSPTVELAAGQPTAHITRQFRSLATIGLCCLVAALDGADMQSLAIAAPPLSRDLGIGRGELGSVFSANQVGMMFGALACGAMADHLGPKRVMVMVTLIFGIFQALTVFAADYITLLGLRFGTGIGLGGATPCLLALAAFHCNPEARARTVSIALSFLAVGSFLGGIINGWTVAHLGWRTMFAVTGSLTIILALVTAVVASPTENDRHDRAAAPHAARLQLVQIVLRDRILRVRLSLLVFTLVGSFAPLAGIILWVPSMTASAGADAATGGHMLSAQALGAVAGMSIAGATLSRFGPGVLVASSFAAAACMILLAMSLGSSALTLSVMVAIGFTLGFGGSGAIAWTGVLFPDHVRAGGLGFAMAILRLSQALVPAAMGGLLVWDFTAPEVLMIVSVLPIAGGIAAFCLPRGATHGPNAAR